MDKGNNDSHCWSKTAIRQGYLIKFHRSLIKTPKMQYFILTAKGLISFSCKPDEISPPLRHLPFEELTSLKLDQVELSNGEISCVQISSKTNSNFSLGFSRKQERDDWMTSMLTAYSEAFISSRKLSRNVASKSTMKLTDGVSASVMHLNKVLNNVNGPSLPKRKKTNNGQSLRRSKSYEGQLNNRININSLDETCKDTSRLEGATLCHETSRKRKSEPFIDVVSHFPSACNLDSQQKGFRNSYFEHRDSLTLLTSKGQCSKGDVKTNIVSRILSKLENSSKRRH